MKITKFGHSCLLIEENDARILVDPGAWSTGHTDIRDIDAILLTHEHVDHSDPASLRILREHNPHAVIYANDGVGAVLIRENIPFERFVHGEFRNIRGVLVEAHGLEHALIYSTLPIVQNTGYFIADRLFVTGDAFFPLPKKVDILAVPVCAPWLRLAEAIDYVKKIGPAVCFPVHDGMLRHTGPFHRLPGLVLEKSSTTWMVLEHGQAYDF